MQLLVAGLVEVAQKRKEAGGGCGGGAVGAEDKHVGVIGGRGGRGKLHDSDAREGLQAQGALVRAPHHILPGT